MDDRKTPAEYEKLHKTQTGLAAEFFAAAELTRRGFIVTLTFGNTKAVDLIVMNDRNQPVPVQVKGIQRTKSVCWNVNRDAVQTEVFYILVNLHADSLQQPEYFVLSGAELRATLKLVDSGRDYIDYTAIRSSPFKDAWSKIRIAEKK